MRAIVVAAALGALGVAGLAANPAVAVGLGQQYPRACASGYHADSDGNCQPNAPQYNRFCAPGLVYQPDPLGWFCAPPPPRDSY
jgi:hypothetical protein